MRRRYFEWMKEIVCPDSYTGRYFEQLLNTLYDTEYIPYKAMDINRVEDALAMRERFCDEHDISYGMLNFPCSMLEMMVALACRIEDNIMHSDEIGDRTPKWFWGMVDSLGLGDQDDGRFDDYYVNDILLNFMENHIKHNGKGGLFTVHHSKIDMRKLDIWYQMQTYLIEIDR